MELREPRQGIQFGVISASGGGYKIPVRTVNADSTVSEVESNGQEVTVDVPFRQGRPA